MITIPLQAIPNQSLSIQLDSQLDAANPDNTPVPFNFDITINSNDQTPDSAGTATMSVSITVNSNTTPTLLIDNVRCVPGSSLLPYAYLYNTYGNFVFTTQNDAYPDYNEFGITQFLIYISAAELVNIEAESV